MATPPVISPPVRPPSMPIPAHQTPAVRRVKKLPPPRIPLHAEDPLFARFIHAVINKERVRIEYVQGLVAKMPVKIPAPVMPLQQRYGQETWVEGTAAAISPRSLCVILDGGPIVHLPRTWVVGFTFFSDPPVNTIGIELVGLGTVSLDGLTNAELAQFRKLPSRPASPTSPATPPATVLKP